MNRFVGNTHKNPIHQANSPEKPFYWKFAELGSDNGEAVAPAKVPRDSEGWINYPDEILAVLEYTVVMINLEAKD